MDRRPYGPPLGAAGLLILWLFLLLVPPAGAQPFDGGTDLHSVGRRVGLGAATFPATPATNADGGPSAGTPRAMTRGLHIDLGCPLRLSLGGHPSDGPAGKRVSSLIQGVPCMSLNPVPLNLVYARQPV